MARVGPQRLRKKKYLPYRISQKLRQISGFRSEVDGNFVLTGYYPASTGSSLLTVQDDLSVPFSKTKKFLTIENGTDNLSRNVGKRLALLVV